MFYKERLSAKEGNILRTAEKKTRPERSRVPDGIIEPLTVSGASLPLDFRYEIINIFMGLPWWRQQLRIHLPMQGTRV